MKQRDRTAMAVLRTALPAIDNAEAVPIGDEHPAAIESLAVGVGRTEADRRQFTRAEEIEIVKQEVRDRRGAADTLTLTSQDAAHRLRSDAEMLQTLLDGLAVDGCADLTQRQRP